MGKTVKDLGLDGDHVDYLTHMSHQFHGPTDFDNEVQKHLDKLYSRKNAPAAVPKDWSTPQSDYENAQKQEQDALSNLSEGGPPTIPSPPPSRQPPPLPSVPS